MQRFHVPQPDVFDHRQIVGYHPGIDVTDGREGDHLDLVQLVGQPGGLNVSLDVDLLPFKLVGVYLEALEQRREGQVGQ